MSLLSYVRSLGSGRGLEPAVARAAAAARRDCLVTEALVRAATPPRL